MISKKEIPTKVRIVFIGPAYSSKGIPPQSNRSPHTRNRSTKFSWELRDYLGLSFNFSESFISTPP